MIAQQPAEGALKGSAPYRALAREKAPRELDLQAQRKDKNDDR
jgi:hypothetical protein